jgi:enoyl-CoA hydratase/carnithine racemase
MEAKWGLIPGMDATITTRELVRINVAKELTFYRKMINDIQAENLGLVTRTCDDPTTEAMKVAKHIVSKSPDSVAAAKGMYQKSLFESEIDCLELETEIQKRLLYSWNKMAASGMNFGVDLSYKNRQDFDTV